MATIANNPNFNFNTIQLSAFVNGERLVLDNSNVVFDSDNRWGYNGAVFGNLTIDSVLGGSILIDGTKVWELPFNSSSGFVPKLSAIEFSSPSFGSTSNAHGELIGVWDNVNFEPISATQNNTTLLPNSGFIKLRSKTGNFISGEQVVFPNGSTVTISSSGNRSWINIAGRGSSFYSGDTNVCSISARGDWYYLNPTNGQYNQQIKIPVKDLLNGIWVEKTPNSNQYDQWLHAATTWGVKDSNGFFVFGALSANGRVFSCNPNNGTITIAYSGTDGMFGYLPPAGCKIRIPNIFLSNSGRGTGTPSLASANGAYADNIVPYSSTHKFYFERNTYKYDLDKVNTNWEIGYLDQLGTYKITNSSFTAMKQFIAAVSCTFKNCIISCYNGLNGLNFNNTSNSKLEFLNCDYVDLDEVSITATNSSSLGAPLTSSSRGFQLTDCDSYSLKNCLSLQPNSLINSQANFGFQRNSGFVYSENLFALGGQGISLDSTNNVTIKNFYGASKINGRYDVVGAGLYGISISNAQNTLIDGIYGVPELEKAVFNSIINIPSPDPTLVCNIVNLTNNLDIRNVGTETRPLTTYSSNANPGNWGVFTINDASNVNIRNVHCVSRKLVNNINSSTRIGRATKNVLLENIYNYPSFIRATNADSTHADDPHTRNCVLRGTMMVPITASNVEPPLDVPGSHWRDTFTNQNDGYIYLMANSPSEETNFYVTSQFGAGLYKSGFLGDGKLALLNQGDSVTWETPYYILGHTGFKNIAPIIRGTGPVTNFTATFQYDNTRNGYNGQWLTLNAANLSSIVINPTVGIKLKIKLECTQTGSNNLFYFLFVQTNTDAISQKTRYSLPKTNSGSILNLQVGSRIQLYNETTQTEIYNQVYTEGTTFTYSYNNGEEITSGDVLRARLTYVNGTTAKLRQELRTVATPLGFTFFADQEEDEVYNTNSIDGTTVVEFNADYPNIEVDISDADQQTSIPRLYAWWVANEYTEDGIANYFGGLIAEDFANYRVITEIVDNFKLDNLSNQGVVFLGNFRLYRDDGGIPVVTTTTGGGSIILYAGNVNITTIDRDVPSLTPQESATLNKINTLPQDTFNLNLSSITLENSIGMRLKNSATVANVGQIITDAFSI